MPDSTSSTKEALLQDLANLQEECREPGWDGHGAEPLNPLSVTRARAFLSVWPEDLMVPECCGCPAGDVTLEWYWGKDHLLSIGFPESPARLYGAWLCGAARGHGTVAFDNATLPAEIEELFNRLLA